MSNESLGSPHIKSAREFFDGIMQDSDQNAAFTALRFNSSAASAYLFYEGYLDQLKELPEFQSSDRVALHDVAKANITYAAFSCVSGYERGGRSVSQQFGDVMGEWHKVFEAVELQLSAEHLLKS